MTLRRHAGARRRINDLGSRVATRDPRICAADVYSCTLRVCNGVSRFLSIDIRDPACAVASLALLGASATLSPRLPYLPEGEVLIAKAHWMHAAGPPARRAASLDVNRTRTITIRTSLGG